MHRLLKKRWWTLILMLGALLAGVASGPQPSLGDGTSPLVISEGGGGGMPSFGDPDGPAGPGRRTPLGGRVQPGGVGFASSPVGDGDQASRVWVWRLRVVLQGLLARFVRS